MRKERIGGKVPSDVMAIAVFAQLCGVEEGKMGNQLWLCTATKLIDLSYSIHTTNKS